MVLIVKKLKAKVQDIVCNINVPNVLNKKNKALISARLTTVDGVVVKKLKLTIVVIVSAINVTKQVVQTLNNLLGITARITIASLVWETVSAIVSIV